jgi:CRISPR-associated protein Cmr2
MSANWDALLLAYLHDPPDKALDIQGHPDHACRYAGSARGEPVVRSQLKNRSDALASVAERFPAPHWSAVKVDPDQGGLTVNHPLSGRPRQLPVGSIDEAWVVKQIQSIVDGLGDDRRRRFLALWRCLSEQLADAAHPWFASLPADTRTPDHTIWHHLDITAGLQATEDTHGRAFLAFALGPVQRFIEAARSVRDLWSGSMILSWLAFRAMLPVIEQFGPAALVYPVLRDIPLLDLWLRDAQRLEGKVPLPPTELRLTPSLPHRFLALVPWGANGETAQRFAAECQQAADRAVKELAGEVKTAIKRRLDDICPGWDKRWDSQIKNYFRFSTAVLPLAGSGEEMDGRLA